MADLFKSTGGRRGFAGAFLLGILVALSLSQPVRAQEQEACTEALTEAEALYLEGQFSEVVARLQACLGPESASPDVLVSAYRLMSFAYLNNEQPEEARRTLSALLARVPTYEPDPIQDPPSYWALFQEVRQGAAESVADPVVDSATSPEEPPPAPPEEAVSTEEEVPVAEQPVVSEERPPPPPPEATMPVETARPSWLQTPKRWVLFIGGAIVAGTAAIVAAGGE